MNREGKDFPSATVIETGIPQQQLEKMIPGSLTTS
jgi:hypothetical protein